MSSNRSAKEALIRLYGAECFIDRLGFRKDKGREYVGKGQYKKMKQLTYHHIKEKSKGGKATLENGALLSEGNHRWFNAQSREAQAKMNEAFQEYKRRRDEMRECKVEFTDDLDLGIEVKFTEVSFEDKEREPKEKFNRAKVKEEFRKRLEEEEIDY